MTAQIYERLKLDGEETSIAFCPPLPEEHPRIYEPKPEEVVTDETDCILGSTACWRRYLGTWEIKDGRFYLIGLRGRFQLRDGGPIHADWFSGVLRILKGKRLQYIHMGFGSVYEQEVHIKIKDGLVLETRVIDNCGKKQNECDIGWRNLLGGENEDL